MKIQHPPEVIAQLEANALHIPHGLFVADRVLQVNVDAFVSTVTFAHSPVNGAINPVATIQMATPVLKALADKINAELASRAKAIRDGMEDFGKSLPKANES